MLRVESEGDIPDLRALNERACSGHVESRLVDALITRFLDTQREGVVRGVVRHRKESDEAA